MTVPIRMIITCKTHNNGNAEHHTHRNRNDLMYRKDEQRPKSKQTRFWVRVDTNRIALNRENFKSVQDQQSKLFPVPTTTL